MTLCFSDVESRETMRRLKELAFAFGSNIGEPMCETLKEYLGHMKELELKRKYWVGRSPQLKHRKHVTEYIMKICFVEDLSIDTAFLALYLFDRFSDEHDIPDRQMLYIAMVCLVLAGKLLEVDIKVPKYRKYCQYVPRYKPEHFGRFAGLERFVIHAFNFDLLVPTEINFLQYFLMFGVDGMNAALAQEEQEEVNNNTILPENAEGILLAIQAKDLAPFDRVNGSEKFEAIRETAYTVLQHLVIEEPTNDFAPSCIAASVLMFSRRENGLNFWTLKLETATSYSLEDVTNCMVEYIEPRVDKDRFREPFTPPRLISSTLTVHIVTA